MNNFLSTLGLCKKVGKIIWCFDAVCDEVQKPKSKVQGVFTAKDLSEKSLKELRFICDKYNVSIFNTEVTMDEIKTVLTKRTGIIAITDEGLVKSLSGLNRKPQNENL